MFPQLTRTHRCTLNDDLSPPGKFLGCNLEPFREIYKSCPGYPPGFGIRPDHWEASGAIAGNRIRFIRLDG